MNEAEFLKQQAKHAKAAFGSSLRNAGHDAVKLADPRIWAKSHPWATVAVAAAAGFVAANIPIPPRKPSPAEEPAPKQQETPHRLERLESLFHWLKQIIALAKPLLEAWLVAKAAAADPQFDGHHTSHDPAATGSQSS